MYRAGVWRGAHGVYEGQLRTPSSRSLWTFHKAVLRGINQGTDAKDSSSNGGAILVSCTFVQLPAAMLHFFFPWCVFAIVSFLISAAIAERSDQTVLADSAKRSNESLLWGPYRPNLYFGVRPRIPKSLTTGLLWAKVDDFQTIQNSMCLRHYPLQGPC